MRPARQRIAVAHGVFPELVGRLDQRLRVDRRHEKALQVRHQVLEPARARPVLLARRRRVVLAHLGGDRPVGEPPVLARALADRIDHEFRRHAARDDHRTPGEEHRPVDGTAPQHHAVPARRALVGIKTLAHEGVDAVGTDQHVAARGRAVRAAAVEEIGGDAGLVLAERAEPVAGTDAPFAEPRARRLVDQPLQSAAMYRELRHLVAGVEPARFAPDLLAEAVGVEQLVGADADGIEGFEQAQLSQFLDGVRERVDPDAELADGLRLLVELAIDPPRVQHQRRGETTDAAPDNDDFHDNALLEHSERTLIMRYSHAGAQRL